ncbi:cellulase [Tieghemostelium lacteum]|uniref:cellulase n=1 Tax=Tieghemostelium lacteum TaxID=361077 RepID=A0A151ZF09_TIELA|nr:cellulase [Tieghemostelium lacteum]|eukprot:KYQ92548.1 cellulase [Tieghemostelium lacteum]
MKLKLISTLLIISLILTGSMISAADDYCSLLEKSLLFYKANRAGRLPDDDIPWRGDTTLNDAYPSGAKDANGDGNLSGGYFDAGDGVKFVFPMAYSMTMLGWGYIEFESNINACGLGKMYRDTIKYGTDWLIAAHVSENEMVGQVGNGGADHAFWGPPEAMTMARPVYVLSTSAPGTEVAMEAASALAAASIVFKSSDPSYASTCLSHAKQLYSFGYNYQGVYSDSIPDAKAFYQSYSGYNDEIAWGGTWLYKATGDSTYLNQAKSIYASKYIGSWGVGQAHSWENKAIGSSLLLFKVTGDSTYSTDFEKAMNYWLPGGGITYTPGGLAWLAQWGPNRYTMTMTMLAKIYGSSKYTSFAQNQMNYILGQNPNSQSFVVGYGPNHPINPHHRAAHHSTTNDINNPVNNVYLLTGALVGGPDQSDKYQDLRTDYIANEVACDYQAGFVGTLAALVSGSGSTSSSSSTSSTSSSTSSKPTTSSTSSTSSSSSTSSTSSSSTSSNPTTSSTSSTSDNGSTSSISSSSGTSDSTTSSGVTTNDNVGRDDVSISSNPSDEQSSANSLMNELNQIFVIVISNSLVVFTFIYFLI